MQWSLLRDQGQSSLSAESLGLSALTKRISPYDSLRVVGANSYLRGMELRLPATGGTTTTRGASTEATSTEAAAAKAPATPAASIAA